MPYLIDRYSNNALDPGWPVVLNEGQLDTASAPIKLFGPGYTNYGEILQEDIVHIMENFAGDTPPANPLTGMLWYDTVSGSLKVWDGLSWTSLGSGGGGGGSGSSTITVSSIGTGFSLVSSDPAPNTIVASKISDGSNIDLSYSGGTLTVAVTSKPRFSNIYITTSSPTSDSAIYIDDLFGTYVFEAELASDVVVRFTNTITEARFGLETNRYFITTNYPDKNFILDANGRVQLMPSNSIGEQIFLISEASSTSYTVPNDAYSGILFGDGNSPKWSLRKDENNDFLIIDLSAFAEETIISVRKNPQEVEFHRPVKAGTETKYYLPTSAGNPGEFLTSNGPNSSLVWKQYDDTSKIFFTSPWIIYEGTSVSNIVTVPADRTRAYVVMYGRGANGGPTVYSGGDPWPGYGGGGGAYLEVLVENLVPGSNISVTINSTETRFGNYASAGAGNGQSGGSYSIINTIDTVLMAGKNGSNGQGPFQEGKPGVVGGYGLVYYRNVGMGGASSAFSGGSPGGNGMIAIKWLP